MKKPLIAFIAVIAVGAGAQALVKKSNQKETNMSGIAASYDVCDTSLIYDETGGYRYSLPKVVMEKFLSGAEFGNQPYKESELALLREDINALFQTILSENLIKAKEAVLTAGAPGAGKTIKMRQDLAENGAEGRIFAYIDPDDVALQNMARTYKADIEGGEGTLEERRTAYNKWRPGSNAAAHLILANLIREEYAFYFGTTSSGPATGKFFEFIKNQGYHLRLIHVTAPDDVRWESIKERDKTFVQTTEEDVRQKGELLPQRITDTFLKYADEIEFCYRDGVHQDAQLAARWHRNENPAEVLGTLEIVSSPQYEQIKGIHNAAVKVLNKPELLWEETVEKNSKITSNT